MTLRSEIVSDYIDGNGLVGSSPTPPGTGQSSDNGVMYFSEYHILLLKNNEATLQDTIDYITTLSTCIDQYGLLHRVPSPTPPGQSNRQEGPDDYYAVFNACKQLGITSAPKKFLKATLRFFGSLNNEEPGKWTARGFLIRQPAFIAGLISSAFPYKTPQHILIRSLFFPFYLITGIIVAMSGMRTDIGDTSSRRITWHIGQTTKDTSLLCNLGHKIWLRRLYKQYGPEPMKAVAKIYYGENHPFTKYWVTN